MIHFDEIKDKVIEHLNTVNDSTDAPGKLYAIRDVYGKISIYAMGDYNLDTLRNDLLSLIGEQWLGQIRSIDESHILYPEITKSIQKISDHLYYGERPLVKKNWNYDTASHQTEHPQT